jgi:hypothetical protein
VRRLSGSWGELLVVAVVCLIYSVSPALCASVPPRYRFSTLTAERVKLHFQSGLEPQARIAMALVLEILPELEARYRIQVPSLDVVLHDAHDSPNGFATVFPYPLIEIRAAAQNGADSGPTESWLRVVITHELTHVVHLEQGSGVYRLGRAVFGRAPFLFPNTLQPTWFIEGLAVREETRGTAFGRSRHLFSTMVVDAAARTGQLARMDQATLGLDIWPRGHAPYLFGEAFLGFLEEKHGDAVARDIAREHARSFRPYVDGAAFRKITGQKLSSLWRDFSRARAASLGGTPAPAAYPLTSRGGVQIAPRLSPDGTLLAYTSRTLDRLGEIRLMATDGSGDRRVARRLAGDAISWTADGRFIVFDDVAVVRKFETRFDLYRVDVSNGRRERLTHDLRASEPDVGPADHEGRGPIVFVQRQSDRSELALFTPGRGAEPLTRSPPGTEWSHPRFSPSGDAIVAARLFEGFMDLVLVNVSTGEMRPFMRDRALDAEPAWVDESTVIFRSDRGGDGFRAFLVNRDRTGLRHVEGAPGSLFTPEVDVRTGTLFFAAYSARGFDLARVALDEGAQPGPFWDPFPQSRADPVPFDGAATPYRSLCALRPRFVTPYAEVVSDEWRLGLATLSFDPLLRTAYGLAGSWGTRAGRLNSLAYLRLDHQVPTITGLLRVESSPSAPSPRRLAEARVSVDFPLERAYLREQTVSLTIKRRREELTKGTLDTGVLAVGWQFDSTRSYPMSISPQDGLRLRVTATRELGFLGSDLDAGKLIVDGAAYRGLGRNVLVTRLGGGVAFGTRGLQSAFGVGGLASPALLDPSDDKPAVLRGYSEPPRSDPSRFGRRLAFGNLELRVPLAHPQRGVRTLPFFVRHVALSASLDAALISSRALRLRSARVGASLGLSAHLFVGHRLPVVVQAGLGQGLTRDGELVPWFSVGFPF